ncbi:MAG: hypothetical protein GX222_04480 [Ruminococcaceae bacterium]|nr:hypothetical protein [Oscillospiraceae bacterium]
MAALVDINQEKLQFVREYIDLLIEKYGDIHIAFALPNQSEKLGLDFTLFLSASWFNRFKTSRDLLKLLFTELRAREKYITLNPITRITLVAPNDRSLASQLIKSGAIYVQKSISKFTNCTFAGVHIQIGYAFELRSR